MGRAGEVMAERAIGRWISRAGERVAASRRIERQACSGVWLVLHSRNSPFSLPMSRFLLALAAFLTCLVGPLAAQQPEKPKITLTVEGDFLALQVRGQAPAGTTAVQFRLAEAGEIAPNAAWSPAPGKLSAEGAFEFALPLRASRWSQLQVRALQGEVELAKKSTQTKRDVFEWLTPERIAALPEPERAAWTAYLARSAERRAREYDLLAGECRGLGRAKAQPAPGTRQVLEMDSDTSPQWFAQPEAVRLAEAAISFQTPSGGWSKAVDYAPGPRTPGMHWTSQAGDPWHYCGTFDNRTTTEQLKLLAGVFTATRRDDVRAALERGLEYVFEAQYPNGGWPQNYPVESGYHEAITLNDDAMVHVLEILLAVAEQKAPFAFANEALRARARVAFDKGLACLAAMQVRIGGELTVWCAQHDPLTLQPVHARLKEPPSLSGAESAEVVRFLMRKAPLSPQNEATIVAALAWFEKNRLTGLRQTKTPEGRSDYVEDAASKEVYWARFYDLQTGRAIFPGAQDGINYPTFREMAAKNKVAYAFLTTKPEALLTTERARWEKRLTKGR